MTTRTVRLTLWPDRDVQVGEQEFHSLRKQGLVLPEEQPQSAQEAPSAPPKSAGRPAADDATDKEN